MAFRKGGKVKHGHRANYGQEQISFMKYYKHEGITLQTSGKSFTTHNKDKLMSIVDIQSLSKLSTGTAIILLSFKIVPVLTYGLKMLWKHQRKQPKTLESIKMTYLEKALRVSRFIPS
jgi:hypothetical protein